MSIFMLMQQSVVGFTIARNYFTLQLRLPKTDVGLASGLVVILLEIQLAYAIASSTLSASKAFTESFNSGWGLGFTRSAGEDSYGLSDISGKSGSSKDEKSYGASDARSTTASASLSASRSRDGPASQPEIPYPLPPPPAPPSESPLKLRPGGEGKTITSVTAEPGQNEHGPWTTESASSSNYSTNDDMNIHAQTEVEIHRDDAPMLRLPGTYA